MERLLKGPTSGKLQPVLDSKVRLIGTSVKDGICYVNFDDTFLQQESRMDPALQIEALVRSLMEKRKRNPGSSDLSQRKKVTKATKAFLWNNRLTAKLLGRRRSRSEKETTLSPVHLLFAAQAGSYFDNGENDGQSCFSLFYNNSDRRHCPSEINHIKTQILTIGNLEKQSRQKKKQYN